MFGAGVAGPGEELGPGQLVLDAKRDIGVMLG